MKRNRIPQRKSRRKFTRTAKRVNPRNRAIVQRGGIRL